MKVAAAVLIILLASSCAVHAADVRVSVGEVKDTRSTGKFFNELELKLNLTGDDVPAIRGVRADVTKGVDATGRSILKNEEKGGYETFRDSASGSAEVTLKFRNPARKAETIRELAGELRIFMPDLDPAAMVTVSNVAAKTGKPLADPALVREGVELTILSKADYDRLMKRQEEEKLREEGKKEGVPEAMMKMVEGFMGMFFDVGEHDLIVKIADPGKKVIDVEVIDAAGKAIQTNGSMTSEDSRVLKFAKPLPEDARLRVYLGTAKALVTVPFKLANIPLP